MSIDDLTPVGAPCHIELFSNDTDRARAFYGELFGWTSESSGDEFGGYINFFRDGAYVAGLMGNHDPEHPADFWSVYLRVEDAEATVAAAEAHGGSVFLPPMAVGDLGHMAMCADPGGAAIGIWQPGVHRGFEVRNEANAPSWFELHTSAYDASVAFYVDVFGWDAYAASDVPEFRYTTLGEGDGQLAGIMDASIWQSEPEPGLWSVYFEVPEADAALAKVVELGGSVIMPAEATPYGTLATAADPMGSIFKFRANA